MSVSNLPTLFIVNLLFKSIIMILRRQEYIMRTNNQRLGTNNLLLQNFVTLLYFDVIKKCRI